MSDTRTVHKRSDEAGTKREDAAAEKSQLNVRIEPLWHGLARRMAQHRGISLGEYVQSLIERDVSEEQDRIAASYDEQIEELKREEDRLRNELLELQREISTAARGNTREAGRR